MKRAALCLVLAALVPLAAVAAADPPDRMSRDERLQKKLTLTQEHMRLGELADKVGEATGVRLDVDDRLGPASGLLLTVAFRERAAWEILAALPRLYSVPGDRWYWERAGRAETPRYVLRHTLPLEAAGAAREAFIEEFMLQQHRRSQAFFKLSPEEKQKAAAGDPFLDALTKFPERAEGLASIVGMLSDQELRAAIRGAQIEIPLSRLNAAQMAYLRKEPTYYGMTYEENGRPLILRRNRGDDHLSLISGRVGVGALGGYWLRQPLVEYGERGWKGDGETLEAEDRPFPAPGEKVDPAELTITRGLDSAHAAKLARLGHVDVLLDEVRTSLRHAPLKLGPKLADALAAYSQIDLMSKRWGSTYLLRSRDWPIRSIRDLVPWGPLAELRRSAAGNGGYLTREDWMRLAEASQFQLERLYEEFPDAGYIRQFQPILRLAGTMSEAERALLARPEGAGWNDFGPAVRQRMLVLFAPSDARSLRLMLKWEPGAMPPKVRLYSGPDAPRPVVIEFAPRKPVVEPPPAAARPEVP